MTGAGMGVRAYRQLSNMPMEWADTAMASADLCECCSSTSEHIWKAASWPPRDRYPGTFRTAQLGTVFWNVLNGAPAHHQCRVGVATTLHARARLDQSVYVEPEAPAFGCTDGESTPLVTVLGMNRRVVYSSLFLFSRMAAAAASAAANVADDAVWAVKALVNGILIVPVQSAKDVLTTGSIGCANTRQKGSANTWQKGSLPRAGSWAKARSKLSVISFATFSSARAAERAAASADKAEADALSATLEFTRLSALRKLAPDDNALKMAHAEASKRVKEATVMAKRLIDIATVSVQAAAAQTSHLLKTISSAALQASPSLAVDIFATVVLPRLAPLLRTALGRAIRDYAAKPDGMRVDGAGLYTLHVLRPNVETRRRLDQLMHTNLSKLHDAPNSIIPKLAIYVHRGQNPPPLDSVFDSDFFTDSSLGVENAAAKLDAAMETDEEGDGEPHAPSQVHAQNGNGAKSSNGGRSHKSSYVSHPEPMKWPATWASASERQEVVSLDLVLDLGVRLNWTDDPVYAALKTQHCMLPNLQAGISACVMRARVRVWWHMKKHQLKLAILDGTAANATHFRSFAEIGLCGCKPMADMPGLTSSLMKIFLSRFTQEHPLEIDLPRLETDEEGSDSSDAAPRKVGEIRWTSGLTKHTYRYPLKG